jgi:hypothetical protein
VIVQGGAYGEHRIESVSVSGKIHATVARMSNWLDPARMRTPAGTGIASIS